MNRVQSETLGRLEELSAESLEDLVQIRSAMTEYLTSCSVMPLSQLRMQMQLSSLVEQVTEAHSQFKSMMEANELGNGLTPLTRLKPFSNGSVICSQLISGHIAAWEIVAAFARSF